MKQAQNWDFYSEDKDGNRNIEGSRFTSKPGSNKLWKFLKESLDCDDDIVKVGYEVAPGQPLQSGQQGQTISK